ncbi:MAG: hypothetical protein K0M46_03245 [Thiobacillus sp.]|nr:hypothetical protein [Thiobacillus sp.]
MTETLMLAIWLILLALAVPEARRAKHPRVNAPAAFLPFVGTNLRELAPR